VKVASTVLNGSVRKRFLARPLTILKAVPLEDAETETAWAIGLSGMYGTCTAHLDKWCKTWKQETTRKT